MTEIELPWPPAELFPNEANRRTGHWGYEKKARLMRTLAWGLTAQALGPKLRAYAHDGGEIRLAYALTPPMRRGKVADEDNVLSALKPARDGIADALGVDDRHFRNLTPQWHPREGAGKVVISF